SELYEYSRDGRTRYDPKVSARVSSDPPLIPPSGTWAASRYATSDTCKIILYVNFDQTESEHFIDTSLRIKVRSLKRTTAGWYKNDKASITLSGHYAANRFPNPANAAWNNNSNGKVHTLEYQVFTD